MINLKTYKQILAKNGITNLSDSEIVKLKDRQEQMADIFFAMWFDKFKKDNIEV